MFWANRLSYKNSEFENKVSQKKSFICFANRVLIKRSFFMFCKTTKKYAKLNTLTRHFFGLRKLKNNENIFIRIKQETNIAMQLNQNGISEGIQTFIHSETIYSSFSYFKDIQNRLYIIRQIVRYIYSVLYTLTPLRDVPSKHHNITAFLVFFI